jgi:hypothetical protein
VKLRIAIVVCLAVAMFPAEGVWGAEEKPAKKPPAPNLLKDFRAGPMEGVEEIVFACRQSGPDGHWYANFSYYVQDPEKKLYGKRGRLCKLNLKTRQVTVLIDDPEGTVRDPQVHYDAEKIIFSYRPGGTESFHLYEINVDGTGLRQLTDGPFDDFEPTYLPDGNIMFVSSRCKRWVNCHFTQVAVLYRCDGDGSNVVPISSNNEHENTPWPLPDGRVIYQRWEYVDRSQMNYHHLWTVNPDGARQMVYYGNFNPGRAMLDAKPIPGSDKVVAVFCPKHGRKDHDGIIMTVDQKAGPDDLSSEIRVSPEKPIYRDPYPFSENCFLMASGPSILVMNANGQSQNVYRLPEELVEAKVQCHEPRPIIKRARERVIPPVVDHEKTTGRLILSDAYTGRRMNGVEAGDIRKLLVLESLPMPAHYHGGMTPITMGGSFTLERVLGTVPVHPDGSAYFEAPALRSLIFVALDENDDSVKRMQSFVTLMPGETTSCVGCHEHRTKTPENRDRKALMALQGPPSPITPVSGIPEVFDFPRHIQPILDRHCLRCHDYNQRRSGVILTGDRGPIYSHSYATLTARKQIADGRNEIVSNRAPRTIGAVASPLMKKIGGRHHAVTVDDDERKLIRFWIEAGAPYAGTYAALGSGMIGGVFAKVQDISDREWPESVEAAKAINARCGKCHQKEFPRFLSSGSPTLRHSAFNLTRPEKSLMLLAPLAKKAGGFGTCKPRDPKEGTTAEPVFTSTDDPGYQKILALCEAGKRHLDKITRFDMPGFQPTEPYVREMKRYGILEKDVQPTDPIDVYATDRAYWESLWWSGMSVAKVEHNQAR